MSSIVRWPAEATFVWGREGGADWVIMQILLKLAQVNLMNFPTKEPTKHTIYLKCSLVQHWPAAEPLFVVWRVNYSQLCRSVELSTICLVSVAAVPAGWVVRLTSPPTTFHTPHPPQTTLIAQHCLSRSDSYYFQRVRTLSTKIILPILYLIK